MTFNSIEFAIFLPVVFAIYWFVVHRNLRMQNLFLVVASYVFYGWWDWRFLSLILFSSLTDFTIGFYLQKTEEQRKRRFIIFFSFLVNLGLLGFFKYYNFFVDSFIEAFTFFGVHLSSRSLNVILPVGISFYTFQSLSYTIEVYRKKLHGTSDIIAFMAFVSFFPQLVAGPIEKATRLLPQFYAKRTFEPDKAKDGMRQILWGLFKKVVIADNVAVYVNDIFEHAEYMKGSVLFLGAFYFAFQIYADFSGYSDIAIGTARLFGVSLNRNFNYPYFSTDILDFWKRWHISLSTWFRDYLFLPLAYSFNRKMIKLQYLGVKAEIWIYTFASAITWFLVGLWHGARWTFVTWGILHGMYLIFFNIIKKPKKHLYKTLHIHSNSWLMNIIGGIFTFMLVLLAWIFFRAETMQQAYDVISGIFSSSFFTLNNRWKYLPLILILVVIEWIQREKQHALEISRMKIQYRWATYYLIIFFMIFAGNFNQSEFIYFQF